MDHRGHQGHFEILISQEAMFSNPFNAEKINTFLFLWLFRMAILENTKCNMHKSFDQIPLTVYMNYESMKGTVTDYVTLILIG